MKIGGYQIINLKGKNLTTGVGMVYDGLYELIEGTRKPILLSGIQIDDKEYQDVFAELSVNGSNLELRAYGKVFTIQDNNVVIVSDDNSGGGGGSVDGDVVHFEIVTTETVYECEAPANKTWRECVLNNLIKNVNATGNSVRYIMLGIGENLNDILPITLNTGKYIYGRIVIDEIEGEISPLIDNTEAANVLDTDFIKPIRYGM